MKDIARGVRLLENLYSARPRSFFARILACAVLLAAVILVGVAPAAQRAEPRPAVRTAYAEDHVLVKLARGAGTAGRRERGGAEPAAFREERGVQALFGNWYRIGLRPGETVDEAIARLRRTPGIAAAEPDYYLRALQAPNDPVFPQQWNFPMVQAQAAWSQSTGTGVTVAVLDTGMSSLANDFVAGHILPYPSAYGTTEDLNGHGTHVSGTVAQATNNAIGAAGLAYGANVRAVKVLGDSGTGFASNIAQGIYDAALTGDEVINMSLGMSCTTNWPACSTLIVNDAIQEAVDRDVVIVAASGNGNAPFVSFPANHPNVIAVGAVDTAQARAPYSNYGCALSLVAPGGTTSPNPSGGIYQQTYFNGTAQVSPFQGTSMAAPHVAAAAAILRAKYPNATALQVRAALQQAALDLGATGRDNLFGNGLLKINSALAALQAGVPPLPATDVCGNALLVPNPPAVTNAIDLRVASIGVAAATVNPQTLVMGGTAAVAIANWGNVAPSSNYTITVFEDSNANGTVDTGEQLASFPCVSTNLACAIAPFGFSTFTIPLAGTVDFRDRRISAFVDSQGQIAESDETNNVGLSQGVCGVSQPITIQPTQMWTAPANVMEVSTPIVADLNQDGSAEVIYTDGGTLRAVSGQTGLPVPFFTPPTWTLGTWSDAGFSLAVGNLDSDPFLEIIAIQRDVNHVVRAYEHDGTLKWSVSAGPVNVVHGLSRWSPTIADLDHDGAPEVIAVGRILSGATGQVQAVLPTGPKLIGGAAVAVNLDQDADLEVVIGNLAFNRDGSALWPNTGPLGGHNAVVDFDGDGAPDIVHVPHVQNAMTGSVRVYRGSDGAPLTSWTVPAPVAIGGFQGPPTVADVDGDGQPEVAVMGLSSFYVYRMNGALMWSVPLNEHAGTQGIAAFDLNEDGAAELIVGGSSHFMIVTNVGGAPVTVWSLPAFNATWTEYPVVADINGDGHAEILFRAWWNNQGFVRAYRNVNSNWPATRAIWNQYAYHAENVGANGQIPATLPPNWWADNRFLVNPQPVPAGTGPDLTAGQINATPATLSAVIGNAGSTTASPVWVAFYSGAPSSGGTLIGAVNIGTLAPGQFVTATIPHGLAGTRDIHVVADRDGGGAELFVECNEANNKHNRQLTFVPVDVRISKSVSPSALAVGQSGTYTLTIASLSAAQSQNTVVTDTLPPGIQIGTISYAPASCPWTSSQVGQVLTFSRPAGIVAGMVCTITIPFTVTAAPVSGQVQNVATLTDDFDSVPSNNQSSVTHPVVGNQPFDLRVTKSALGTAVRGSNLTYAIYVQNVGGVPAGGPIAVRDTMVGGNSLMAQSPTGGWVNLINGGLRPVQVNVTGLPWTCTIQSSFWGYYEEVECLRNPNAPPIAVGQLEQLQITAAIHQLAGDPIRNTATLIAPNDSNPANNQAVRIDPVP